MGRRGEAVMKWKADSYREREREAVVIWRDREVEEWQREAEMKIESRIDCEGGRNRY